MLIRYILLMISLPFVMSLYSPCTDVFQRIEAPSWYRLIAHLNVSINKDDVINPTFWTLEITFNSPVEINNHNVTLGLKDRKWSDILRVEHDSVRKEKDLKKTTFLISVKESEFNGPWFEFYFFISMDISYKSRYVDVERVEINRKAICSDRNRCGEIPFSLPLIYNGNPAGYGEYPWLGAIHKKAITDISFICGGTLVSTKHVITAAHCLRGENSSIFEFLDLIVVFGTYSTFDTSNENAKTYQVHNFIVHHDWRKEIRDGPSDADIAILILENDVTFTDYIKPACFNLNEAVGTVGTVYGWGQRETQDYSKTPRQTDMPIVSNEECRKSHSTLDILTTKRTFCAGYRNGSGPCLGDSGGGFYTKTTLPGDRPRYSITGIISRSLTIGEICDHSQYAIFTKISSFKTWIDLVINSKDDATLSEISKLPGLHPIAQTTQRPITVTTDGYKVNKDIDKIFVNAYGLKNGLSDYTQIMWYACRNSEISVVSSLLNLGLHVDTVLPNGYKSTCLYYTAENNYVNLAKLLISRRANLNVKTNQGLTPAIVAAHKGNLDVLEILVENGADLSLKDDIYRKTALGHAKLDSKNVFIANFLKSMNAPE